MSGVRIPQGAPTLPRLPKSERLLLWSIAALALVLRGVAWFRFRFDSDEQQHLHIAWAWTAGLLPYRDVFDNHTPLFHLLLAPLLGLLGERSDILLWMRAPMLLLFAAVLWGTWVVGRRLYGSRAALWATALLALFPPFFLKSLEFRNDNLWNALWMVALVILTGVSERGGQSAEGRSPGASVSESHLSPRRGFLAGLLLGAALATSIKTTLLLIALGSSAVVTWLFVLRTRETTSRPPVGLLASFAAGVSLVPLLTAAAFAAAGVLDDLVYCTLTFNFSVGSMRNPWPGRAAFPFAMAAVLWLAWRFRQGSDPRRFFVAVFCAIYAVTLACLWVLISPRDLLPLMPLAAILAAAAITTLDRPLRVFAAIAALSTASLWHYADHFRNRTAWHTTMLDQALRLTRPGEMLIDIKGETIYRRRPFFYALEWVTRAQMARDMIPDTLAADVVRTRTYAAQADGPFWPPAGRAFLSENFVNLGRLRAAGQWLADDGSFSIAIPGPYVILDAQGEAHGSLDGTPYRGARELAAGKHQFARSHGKGTVAVLWAPAFQRGHSPFHLRDLEF